MSQFYKGVETSGTQLRQSKAPTGPDRDAQAHMDAAQERGGIAGAIRDLVGVANTGFKLKKKIDEEELISLEKKFKYEANAAMNGLTKFTQDKASKIAAEQDRNIEDFTMEELEAIAPQIKDEFIQANGLQDKEYFELIERRLDERMPMLVAKRHQMNRGLKLQRNLKGMQDEIKVNFLSMEPAVFKASLEDTLENHVGADDSYALNMSQEEAKSHMLTSIVTTAIEAGDDADKLLERIKSEEMKEFFGEVDHEGTVNLISQQAQAAINKKSAANFERLEELMYMQADNGAFLSEKKVDEDVKKYIDSIDPRYKPSAKDVFKLKTRLKELVNDEVTYRDYEKAMKSGDKTFLDNANITSKQRTKLVEKGFQVQTGIRDTSYKGLSTALRSDQVNLQLKKYIGDGHEIPKSVISFVNTVPSGDPDAVKKHFLAIDELERLAADTSTPITSFMDSKAYGRHNFTRNLVNRLDSNDITKEEFSEVLKKFNSNMKQNVDSFGVYTSPEAFKSSKDNNVDEWAMSYSKDAPYTWDEYTPKSYIKRQLINNYNILHDSNPNLSGDELKEKAIEMFENRHESFENPDGSETVFPFEFRKVDKEALFEVVYNLKSLKDARKAAKLFGTDFMFKRDIQLVPSQDYETTRSMDILYKGDIKDSISVDDFRKLWSVLDTKEKKEIRKRDEARRKRLQHEAKMGTQYKYR